MARMVVDGRVLYTPGMRHPAVPLIVHNPTFSTWSCSDTLTGGWTQHWTGTGRGLTGLLRIDGRPFVFCSPSRQAEAMHQESCTVEATRTVYRFAAAGVELTLTFCAPMLPGDLDLMGWPANLVHLSVRCPDGLPRRVEAYLDLDATWAVDRHQDPVTWARLGVEGLHCLRVGSHRQQVLATAGDDVRGDWGWTYLATRAGDGVRAAIGRNETVRAAFLAGGRLPDDEPGCPRQANDGWPALALAWDLGQVGSSPATCTAALALDEVFTAEYLYTRLRPWWRRDGMEAPAMLQRTLAEADTWLERCAVFDAGLAADLVRAGGDDYADIARLAYRQCVAGHGLAVGGDGRPFHLSKENSSNGCIATLDVTYPGAPFFLLFCPELLEAQLSPLFDYAALPRWRHPFAPHDLGTYPLANGQVYGGGETGTRDQMPVEECGDALILAAALLRAGRPGLAERHRTLLEGWARYLAEHGLDPAEQLCTDDYSGHLARNANLSLKAVIALGAWAQALAGLGDASAAAAWRASAERMAARWLALADAGDHTVLAFGQAGTWSQKYNLVWDRLLGLGLFPPAVARREIAWYLRRQERWGLPIDNRRTWAKGDWTLWSATCAEDPADFQALVGPLATWLGETPDRVPFSDWYDAATGRQAGFRARSVVGGTFSRLLDVRGILRG